MKNRIREVALVSASLAYEGICRLRPKKRATLRETRSISARHESGHALMCLLEGVVVTKWIVRSLQYKTIQRIHALLGDSYFPRGAVLYYRQASDCPLLNLRRSLSGIAAEQDRDLAKFHLANALKEKDLWEEYDDGRIATFSTWELMKDHFEDRKAAGSAIQKYIWETYNQLRQLYSTPIFDRCLTALEGHMLEKPFASGENLNGELWQVLHRADIQKMEKEQMREDFRAIPPESLLFDVLDLKNDVVT